MAFTSRILHAPADVVWDVLIDPHTYPDWLIGAAAIRDLDANWPEVGSRFHHRVGIGWLSIPDYTEIEDIIEQDLLRLGVRARPFISAVSTFRLVGDGNTTVVTIEEAPRLGVIGTIAGPLADPLLHVRNHGSLRRLEHVVLERMNAATRI